MPRRSSIAALPYDLPVRMLDGSPDAIVICDRAGIVRYWNAAAARVFGFCVTEGLGVSIHLIIPDRLRYRHLVGRQRLRRGTRYGEANCLRYRHCTRTAGRSQSSSLSNSWRMATSDRMGGCDHPHVTERFIRDKDRHAQVL